MIAADPPRLPSMPKAVVFDMDGTLFDTETVYHRALLMAAEALGIAMAQDYPLKSVGMHRAATLEAFRLDFAHNAVPLVERWDAIMAEERALSLALKPGALELLDLLDEIGTPYAIATSAYHQEVTSNLEISGLTGRFATIVAQGDYAQSKPHPAPFLVTAQRMAVAPTDCLALEDSLHGVRSAVAAGMMTIMIPDLIQPDATLAASCFHIAQDLHEVREMVERAAKTQA